MVRSTLTPRSPYPTLGDLGARRSLGAATPLCAADGSVPAAAGALEHHYEGWKATYAELERKHGELEEVHQLKMQLHQEVEAEKTEAARREAQLAELNGELNHFVQALQARFHCWCCCCCFCIVLSLALPHRPHHPRQPGLSSKSK